MRNVASSTLMPKTSGLFSFIYFQLMSKTDSLYRPSGFACALPLCINLTLIWCRPLCIFGWTAHGVCLLLCLCIRLYENVKNGPEKSKTE